MVISSVFFIQYHFEPFCFHPLLKSYINTFTLIALYKVRPLFNYMFKNFSTAASDWLIAIFYVYTIMMYKQIKRDLYNYMCI